MNKPLRNYSPKRLTQDVLRRCGFSLSRIAPPKHAVDTDIDIFGLACLAYLDSIKTYFVQIGGNDGKHNDPLRPFIERYHWEGIIVEPVPFLFNRLQAEYSEHPQLTLKQAAISDIDGSATIYAIDPSKADGLPEFWQGLCSLKWETIAWHKHAIPDIEDRIISYRVPSITLESMLKAEHVPKIDLLQIDTEGYDYRILQMVDFLKWHPKIVQYEHKHLSDQDRLAAECLLAGAGYCLGWRDKDTIGILPDSVIEHR